MNEIVRRAPVVFYPIMVRQFAPGNWAWRLPRRVLYSNIESTDEIKTEGTRYAETTVVRNGT
jgi:hypothetical protein